MSCLENGSKVKKSNFVRCIALIIGGDVFDRI